jgi:ferredoxin-NADP reductase
MVVPRHSFTFTGVGARGRDHVGVRLRAEPGFTFVAGQWGNVLLPAAGGGEERRALSFASAPQELPELELCVRRVSGSLVVEAFERAATAARFDLEGPFGAFTWDGSHDGPLLLVASSAGIAPIRSIVRAATAEHPWRHPAALVHALARDRDPPYADEEPDWRRRLPQLQSRRFDLGLDHDEQDPATWAPAAAAALAAARSLAAGGRPLKAWLAGHGALVQPLRETLKRELGLDRRHVRVETFWP